MNHWNELISTLPNPHLLQTFEWGQVKKKYGWTPLYAVWGASGEFQLHEEVPSNLSISAAALLLKKSVTRGGLAAKLSILYSSKGPLLDWSNVELRPRVLADLERMAAKQGAIFLKMDPDIVIGSGIPGSTSEKASPEGAEVITELKKKGWMPASEQIQFRNTVMIDLSPPEDELLSRMKQKTRYNVRLAAKKDVSIRSGHAADLAMLYKMYAETSLRDGFAIRDEGYYSTVWKIFMQAESPHCEALVAEVESEPVAALFLFTFAGRAYYMYGMSRDAHREKMPTYLLQWEAMKLAKATGCTSYDLWGAPEEFSESDRMWGVYRFKEGLGGSVLRTAGAWDYAPNKLWYKMYSEVMPRVLDVMRARGKEQVKQALE
jgi:lipid II:glycine glycyltransferase (peptidoglycan interpeptide bridge formation enzyme)